MKQFKRILVHAGTEQTENAISRAVVLAMENDASLTIMDVIRPLPRLLGILNRVAEPGEMEVELVKRRREALLECASEFSDTAVPIDVVVALGDPATEVVREVLASEIDLVIKTADGCSDTGRLFGSFGRSLLRICPCALLLMKPVVHGDFDCVLAAIDVDAKDEAHRSLNESIAELSMEIARKDKAKLNVVCAWDAPHQTLLEEIAGSDTTNHLMEEHRLAATDEVHRLLKDQSSGVDVSVHVQRGRPASAIKRVAAETQADLLVMGTTCTSGMRGYVMGSTADAVTTDIDCSVLALKPVGFESPAEVRRSHSVYVF